MARAWASGIPDWTDAGAYSALLSMERGGFAWEWLRRKSEYQAAALKALERSGSSRDVEDQRALQWNLHQFEDPRLDAPLARPVWARLRHPWVVEATAEPCGADEDCLDLQHLRGFATVLASPSTEHVLLSDGYRSIRLDVSGAGTQCSPVHLSYKLSGIRKMERPLIVLRRFRSLAISGRFAVSLHPPARRAHRLVQLLRTYDGLAAGASQGEIAELLLRSGLQRRRWRIHSPSLRSQAQRLVRAALEIGRGRLWDLLG